MGVLCSVESFKSCFSDKTFATNLISSFPNEKRKKSLPLSSKDFERIAILGKGSFGKVLLVRKKDNDEILAMKIIKKKDIPDIKCVLMERKVMLECKHPFIVNLRYAFQDESHISFLMEYLEGGDILTALNAKRHKRSFYSIACFYMAEMILGLEYLHNDMNLFNGDLKLSNVLLDGNGHIRFIDFGSSKVIEEGKKIKGFYGTPNYIAPEIVLGEEYDLSADIWSLGCAFYEILMKVSPFTSKTNDLLYKKIVEDEPYFPPETPNPIKDLLTKMLTKDPNFRIKIKEIKKHEFFSEIDWDNILEETIIPPISLKLNISVSTTTHNSSSFEKSLSFKSEADALNQSEFEEMFEDYTTKSEKYIDEI